MVMLFQVMALVVSTGNPSFAVESYSKYRELYLWQPQVLHIFLSLKTNQQAELPTRTHSFLSEVLILKIHKSLLLFALCRQCNPSCKRALIPDGILVLRRCRYQEDLQEVQAEFSSFDPFKYVLRLFECVRHTAELHGWCCLI